MDQLLVDCGPDAGVAPGDDVVLLGRQGDETISAWVVDHQCPVSRSDIGQAATSDSSGSSPWLSRYPRRAPPT